MSSERFDLTLGGVLLFASDRLMGIEVREVPQTTLQMFQVLLEAFPSIRRNLGEGLAPENRRHVIEDGPHEKEARNGMPLTSA